MIIFEADETCIKRLRRPRTILDLAGPAPRWVAPDLEENRHGDSNSTFPAKNYGLPAPRIREKSIQATEMQAVFCWDVKALSLQLGQITLQFPKLQGETGWLQTASTATL